MAEHKLAAATAARQERFPAEVLRQHVEYDPAAGSFKLLIATDRRHAGCRLDALHPSSGYRSLRVLDASHLAHRVAWALMTGEWPRGLVDFINGDRSDCRWANLRIAPLAAPLDRDGLMAAISYDPDTGEFVWKRRPDKANTWNARWAGRPAGTYDKDGYLCITINKAWYKGHRLAVLFMTGAWPPADVDHADLNPRNNRWANLRLATRTENNGNRAMKGRAASGLKGAYLSPTTGRWYSRIQRGAHTETLGTFDTKEEAHAAYMRAAERLYGEFARAG